MFLLKKKTFVERKKKNSDFFVNCSFKSHTDQMILIRWYWLDEAVHSRELIWEFKQKKSYIVHEAEKIIRTFQQ